MTRITLCGSREQASVAGELTGDRRIEPQKILHHQQTKVSNRPIILVYKQGDMNKECSYVCSER